MLCQRCREREATIHEVTIRAGVPTSYHICEVCAAELGMTGNTSESIAELLPEQTVTTPEPVKREAATAKRAQSCGSCGLTFAEFKRSGLLGCEMCYEVFERQLAPLIERAHEGGGHHVGKVPRRALDDSRHAAQPERLAALLGGQKERAERLTELRKQLERAVAAEQYERAAALRDEIRRASDPDEPSEGSLGEGASDAGDDDR
ncbi:MAG: UvrB/UvrC motif-containing protein [Planctomycetota bacterium]